MLQGDGLAFQTGAPGQQKVLKSTDSLEIWLLLDERGSPEWPYTRVCNQQAVQCFSKPGTVTLPDASQSYVLAEKGDSQCMNPRQVQNRCDKQQVTVDLHLMHNLGWNHAEVMLVFWIFWGWLKNSPVAPKQFQYKLILVHTT